MTTAPLDEDWLREHAREQQISAANHEDICRTCPHRWHGVACSTFSKNGCPCPTSWKEAA